jgi:hypothetical protein
MATGAEPAVDRPARIDGAGQAAVACVKSIDVGIAPSPPFRLPWRQIAEQFLGRLLGGGADAVCDIGSRDHEISAAGATLATQGVDVRSIGIEVNRRSRR